LESYFQAHANQRNYLVRISYLWIIVKVLSMLWTTNILDTA